MELDNLKQNWQSQNTNGDSVDFNYKQLNFLKESKWAPLNYFFKKNKKKVLCLLAFLGVWLYDYTIDVNRLNNPFIWIVTISIVSSLLFELKNYMIMNKIMNVDLSLMSNFEEDIASLIKNYKNSIWVKRTIIAVLFLVIELIIYYNIRAFMFGWSKVLLFYRILAYISYVVFTYGLNKYYFQPKFEQNLSEISDLLQEMK